MYLTAMNEAVLSEQSDTSKTQCTRVQAWLSSITQLHNKVNVLDTTQVCNDEEVSCYTLQGNSQATQGYSQKSL